MVAARRPPRRWTLAVLLLAFVLLVAVGSLASFYTDLLWFREVGKASVFWGQLSAKSSLGLLAGLGTALIVGANLWLVERFASRYGLATPGRPQVERYRTLLTPYLRPLRIAIAAFLGLVVGLQSAGLWQTFLLWRNAVRFGQTDPQFHRDIGYYVFTLPFQRALFGWLFSTLVLSVILAAAGHYILGGMRPPGSRERIAPAAQAHLMVLLGLIVALKAWGYSLDRYQLSFSPRGVVTGASYTDVNVQLPALKLLLFVAIICALLFFAATRTRGIALPIASVVLLAGSSLIIGGLVPAVVQRFSVEPQELSRERPYIKRNIDATQHAFALDTVRTTEFPAADDLTQQDLAANRSTVDNIRLWDPEVLTPSIQSLQAIGQYYSFSDVDVDRYPVGSGGSERQVMISAREVDPTQLSQQARTWQNLHLAYTHGFGVVATQVNTASSQGQPDFIVKDFDQANAPIPVQQPRVYFGEPPAGGADYVVVDSKQPEIDAPTVNGTQVNLSTSRYDGDGGIRLSGPLSRFAFALRFRDVNLLLSGNVTSKSRLMFNRDIRDRVEKVAPFLQWDSDPYAAVVDGKVVYIRDGYTVTDNYPYSERLPSLATAANLRQEAHGVHGEANYIRNSVKAVVDAYTGKVTLYAYDEQDPILRAWRKAFPALFAPRSEMSPSLQAHLRYPEDLFAIQTLQYTQYHIEDVDGFYSKEDRWAVPQDRSGDIRQEQNSLTTSSAAAGARMRPYYLLTQLPGQTSPQFILVMPFTPNNKQNMVSYLSVNSDPKGYGDFTLFSLNRSRTVFGPTQVNDRILANSEVARQISLLNQQGSKVTLGNLLIVPIKDSLLYVQPIFVQNSAQNAFPLLTDVAVFYNNQVGFASTLADAIAQVVTGAQPPTQPTGPQTTAPTSGTVQQLLGDASHEYDLAQQALRKGDLAGYQQHINQVGRLLQQATQAAGGKAPATTTTTPQS